MLKLQNVSLQLNEKPILSNINLTIDSEEIVMLLGSNGSGKSSLLKLIDRRYRLQQGDLTINHISIEKYSPKNLSKTVMTLTQNPLDSLFPTLTVKENFRLVHLGLIGREKMMDFETHLMLFNPKLIHHKHTLVSKLSGGEQQALALALACLAKPKILLLDEHTSALDPHIAENLMQLTQHIVKTCGITCIITTHNLQHAVTFGDRLIALQQGKVIRNYHYLEKIHLSLEQIRRECYLQNEEHLATGED